MYRMKIYNIVISVNSLFPLVCRHVCFWIGSCNKDIFETIYEACPSAPLNSVNDDVTPLCIATTKNDKN